jgi:hypothetical protein
MAEFMMIIADDEKRRAKMSPEEFGASYAKVGAWWAEQEAAGCIMRERGHRLQPAQTARTVRVDSGEAVVTDGPFVETREVIGGYGILTVPDMQAAVDVVKTWPGAPVTIEIRPVMAG